mgnify:CR=1 FL=1
MNHDKKARHRALESKSSFIVQAPAGSGKTELLIQRFLMLLSKVDYPEQILAMTFTRKASGEMKTRILKALNGAQTNEIPSSDHEKLTRNLANKVLEKDKILNWRLTENPSRLKIQTIDSFCLGLSQQTPLLSRLGATPLLGNTDQRRKQLQQFLPYGVDVVVEATGDAAVINEGVEQLRVGGQYLFVGMVHPRTALKITGQQIISKCLTLRGIHNYSPCHLDLALRFLKETATKYPYGLLVSAPYSLLHLDEAVEAAKAHSYLRIAVRNDET